MARRPGRRRFVPVATIARRTRHLASDCLADLLVHATDEAAHRGAEIDPRRGLWRRR